MAEFVQSSIEEMLTELEQMQRVGLFTKVEIKQILQKRKRFEHKLRRRTKVKEDYLGYVKYEINLLNLVKKRRKKTGYTHKRIEIEQAIVSRIHRLFRQALVRFQEDVSLWLTHIEFCKARKEKNAASKQYTKMLNIHGNKPDLWIEAAKWEVEENNSMENGRSLLQRGIRYNQMSKSLWIELYRLELLCAEKMQARKEILGVTDGNKQDDVLKGAAASIVYTNAVKVIPDLQFRLSFLSVCQLFRFATHLEEQIFNDILQDQHENPLTWDALAKRCLRNGQNKSKSELVAAESAFHEKYREAIDALQTDEIWNLYLTASMEILNNSTKISIKNRRLMKTLAVFDEASENANLSINLWLQWLDLLSQFGYVDQLAVVGELAVERCPTSSLLWKRHIDNMAQMVTSTSESLIQLLTEAKKSLPQQELWPLIRVVLDFDRTTKSSKYVLNLLEDAMFLCAKVSIPAKNYYLQWVYDSEGIEQARKIYTKLTSNHPKSPTLYQKYIELEMSDDRAKLGKIRRAYEDAVRDFGNKNSDIWLEYVKLEVNHPSGQPEKAGEIYHRAVKTLTGENNQDFINRYTLLNTSREA